MSPPVSLSRLRQYRWRADRRSRGTLGGQQMLRRKGQSSEFRGFVEFQPGMDIRHVDWRTSLRQGDGSRYLAREFEAEQSVRIVLSLDLSASMGYPPGRRKADVARDLAWTIGAIGLMGDDRVVVHSLFGAQEPARELRGAASVRRLWRALESLPEPAPRGPDPRLNLGPLERLLPPASVWIILSDFYFPADDAPSLALQAKIRSARDNRLVLAIDLDSWGAETKGLAGPRRIGGPGRKDEREVELSEVELASTWKRVKQAKQRVLAPGVFSAGHGLLHWETSGTRDADEFWAQFRAAKALGNLFLR